jgi:hypothetical protein
MTREITFDATFVEKLALDRPSPWSAGSVLMPPGGSRCAAPTVWAPAACRNTR